MIKLEKGAPVRVRLHTGEAVEAVFKESDSDGKHHYLNLNGKQIILVKRKLICDWECRLVGNPCDLLPAGVSV